MNRDDIVRTINNLKGEEGHQKVLDVYNSQCPLPRGYKVKKTDAWCATTVSAVYLMNGYPDIAECSCEHMVKKAQALDIWVENDSYRPEPADVIMYDWQDSGKGDDTGWSDHTGIVVAVDGNKITVREGNKGKTIGNRTLEIDGRYIRGYITPRFDDKQTITGELSDIPTKPKNTQETSESVVSEWIIGNTYTVNVKTALNVRKGAGAGYAKVGYNGLTADGKKHATAGGALLPGTKVTCLEVKDGWMRIPSGWICCKYVK